MKNSSDYISICSLNVWGLLDECKRNKIYLWLKSNKFDIVYLQETHCTSADVARLEQNCPGKLYHSCTDSKNSRGVAILISDTFEHSVVSCNTDSDGRRILLHIEHDGDDLTLVNVYAPNNQSDRKAFFTRCEKWIRKYNKSENNLLLGGDMNCCVNNDDRIPVTHLKDASRGALKKLVDTLNLCDCWQVEAQENNKFTWNNADLTIKSRIDYMFVNRDCMYAVKDFDTKIVITCEIGKRVTDHKAVVIKVAKEGNTKGPGYWKMNVEYLADKEFVNIINNVIEITVKECKQKGFDNRLTWDILKLTVKEYSIRYSKRKAYDKKCRIKALERDLENLKGREDCVSKEKCKEYENELDVLYTSKAKGAQIRARAQFVEEGERNTKYFMQLEKSRQGSCAIHCLQIDGKEKTEHCDILEELSDFYGRLYTSDNVNNEEIDRYLNNVNIPSILTQEQKMNCEGLPTDQEIKDVINNMKRGKAPGSDGLPIEFYAEFWNVIRIPFMSFVIETQIKGELPSSTRHAIISLLFKKGDKKLLKNYRPISLTNTDYKIIAFVMSKRVQATLMSIINEDQAGYVKGRYIGNNIRLIMDVYDLCEREEREGAIVCLDFQKAYDAVEWNFMFEVLKRFNFGDDFVRWIKILYNRPSFAIKNNGWLTNKQYMYRGIRQGCPLSCLLFIIVVEILGIQIRNNTHIKGFKIGEKEYKNSQYADDEVLLLSDSQSVSEAIETVEKFSKVAGPKLNKDKVEGIWLGPLKSIMPKSFADVSWTDQAVRCLGIFIGHDKMSCTYHNWTCKLEKIKRTIMQWKRRNLTLLGKIVVIKTLVISKMLYSAALLRPPEHIIKDIDSELKSFIGTKSLRLNASCIIGQIEDGGLNFPDIESVFCALKATWLTRLYNKKSICTNIANYWYGKIGFDLENIMLCNFKSLKVFPVLKKIPEFYQDVLLAYNKCKTVESVLSMKHYEVARDIIWGNERYMFKGKCLYSKSWIDSDIIFIKDIVDNEGKIMSAPTILKQLKNKCNWIAEYQMIRKACKVVEIKEMSDVQNVRMPKRAARIYVENKWYEICDKKNKFFYELLRNKKFKYPYMQNVWCEELALSSLKFKSTWTKVYVLKIKKMPIKKLAEFNFKILAGILPCGKLLHKWIKDIPEVCEYCNITENLKHMLYECKKVNFVWNVLGEYFKIDIRWKHIVIGYFDNMNEFTNMFNLICSMVAYSIFKVNNNCKWKHINFTMYDVKVRIINDLKYFDKIQVYCNHKYLHDDMIKNIVKKLRET